MSELSRSTSIRPTRGLALRSLLVGSKIDHQDAIRLSVFATWLRPRFSRVVMKSAAPPPAPDGVPKHRACDECRKCSSFEPLIRSIRRPARRLIGRPSRISKTCLFQGSRWVRQVPQRRHTVPLFSTETHGAPSQAKACRGRSSTSCHRRSCAR